MFQEKRPTAITVISWAWIVIGGLMLLSSSAGLLSFFMMPDSAGSGLDTPFVFKIFPFLALLQIAFAGLGIYAGISFLKMRAWSRSLIEALTWLLLLFVISFMLYWMYNWLTITSNGPNGFEMAGVAMGAIISLVYGAPLVLMLVSLRGEKVKGALASVTGNNQKNN